MIQVIDRNVDDLVDGGYFAERPATALPDRMPLREVLCVKWHWRRGKKLEKRNVNFSENKHEHIVPQRKRTLARLSLTLWSLALGRQLGSVPEPRAGHWRQPGADDLAASEERRPRGVV